MFQINNVNSHVVFPMFLTLIVYNSLMLHEGHLFEFLMFYFKI